MILVSILRKWVRGYLWRVGVGANSPNRSESDACRTARAVSVVGTSRGALESQKRKYIKYTELLLKVLSDGPAVDGICAVCLRYLRHGVNSQQVSIMTLGPGSPLASSLRADMFRVAANHFDKTAELLSLSASICWAVVKRVRADPMAARHGEHYAVEFDTLTCASSHLPNSTTHAAMPDLTTPCHWVRLRICATS